MAIGSVQYVIVCTPSGNKKSTVPCVSQGNVGYDPVMQKAYVIDASQASNLDAALGDFDYAYAGTLWVFAFSMVVGLFAISRGAGAILEFIRTG